MKVVGRILLIAIAIGLIVGSYYGVQYFLKWLDRDESAWRIEIAIQEVNIREDHASNSKKIGTAKKGNEYVVLEQYLEDKDFVWYKVTVGNGEGWIASDRKDPYVVEYNNPNVSQPTDDPQEESAIEYNPPVVHYYDDVYEVDRIEDINYNRLHVEDESDYKIEHIVFYEEHPIDKDEPQYWIQYIVTDVHGNQTRKVQSITFKHEPSRSQVKDFSELQR